MALSHNCIYGNSGVGKTTLIAQIIRYFFDNFGCRSKVMTCDNMAPLKRVVSDGIAQVWNINERDYPFQTSEMAVQGFWPEDINDPESDLTQRNDYDQYPLRFYEGLSTVGEYMLGSYAKGALAQRAGSNQRVGPGTRPGEDTISFMDGKKKTTPVGGNSRSHYNVVQRAVHKLVIMSYRLPVHVWWSAHEIKAAKDEYGTPHPNFGPEVVGTAFTPKTPRWFDNMLHLAIEPPKVGDKKGLRGAGDRKIFLTDHYDPLIPNIPFKAKIGVPPEDQGLMPEVINNNKEEVHGLLDLLFPKSTSKK
jgi:hypothetical protein